MSGTAPDQVIVRRRAAHTQRHLRRVASWQRSALAACSIAMMLILLSGSSAAVTASTPDQIGDWSAPVAWPLVAVHMSLEPTGLVFMLDGFDAGPNSERLWDPASGTFIPVPYATEPLLLRSHPTRRRPHADRRGPHQCQRGACRHDDLRSDDANLHPSAGHVRRSLVSDRDRAAGRPRPHASPATTSSRIGPGADPPFSDASVNSLPSIFNPKTNTWTDLTGARLTSPLYPVHVRPLRRPGLRRRPGQGDAHPRPRDVDMVDRGHEPVRRPQRGHVPARTRS